MQAGGRSKSHDMLGRLPEIITGCMYYRPPAVCWLLQPFKPQGPGCCLLHENYYYYIPTYGDEFALLFLRDNAKSR